MKAVVTLCRKRKTNMLDYVGKDVIILKLYQQFSRSESVSGYA